MFIYVLGVWDVRGWLPVPGAESGVHRALGAAEQEEQTRVARAAEQPEPTQLRGVQARGVRQVPKRPTPHAERQERTAQDAALASNSTRNSTKKKCHPAQISKKLWMFFVAFRKKSAKIKKSIWCLQLFGRYDFFHVRRVAVELSFRAESVWVHIHGCA